MTDEIINAIHNLNIRYYEMRITEDSLNRYDDSNNESSPEIRKILFWAYKICEEKYDEQFNILEKLINDGKK